MHWTQFDTTFQELIVFHCTPTTIIIHLGGNDLVAWSQSKLLKTFKKQFEYMASVYPNATLVWSDILPRQAWRGIDNTPENLEMIEQKRKRVNRLGTQVALRFGGRAIHHALDFSTHGLFNSDKAHLSLIGNAIFLNTFEEALEVFFSDPEQKVYKAN